MLFFLLLQITIQQDPSDLDCLNFSDISQCNANNVCIWRQWDIYEQCVSLQCHLINDVQQCRTGSVSQRCTAASWIPPQFQDSCYQNIYVGQRIYYYRFISDLTSQQISDTPNLISQLTVQDQSVTNMLQLQNLDILQSSNVQLSSILDLYISYQSYLIKEYSHPYYLERVIYESLQNIRDDQTITYQQRKEILYKIQKLIQIYYQRLTTFSILHQTSYNFIYFNHIHLQYYSLSFQTIATFTWTDYPKSGFFQLTVIYLEIFGLQSPASPVFMVRISNGELLTYKINWAQTTTDPIQLMEIDLLTLTKYDTFIMPVCSNGYCEVELQGAGNYVFINSYISDDCAQLTTREQCHQALCVYHYETNNCQIT